MAIGIAALLVAAAVPELAWELAPLVLALEPEEAELECVLVELASLVATVARDAAIFEDAEETRSE